MRTFLVVGAIMLSSLLVAGCFIITGSTDGYSSAPSPVASSDGAATCAADAECVALTCLGTSDCADAGGVCCLGTASGGGLSSVCQSKCLGPQFCKGDSDCPNNGTCTSQSCSGNGVSAVIRACGLVPGCNP